MRQLTEYEASFLDADTVHANANVTYIQIYDQRTVPGGTMRLKTILAHVESRLPRSPIFRSKLLRVPLELDEPYWVDTLNIAPGARYTVIFRADDPGTWVWHCHILNHVAREDGMFGMVTAIVVTENPDFDPDDVPVRPHNWRKTAGTDGPIDPEAASTDG